MTSIEQKGLTFREKLNFIIHNEERNAVWLSKKLGCSHTLAYGMLSGKSTITAKYRFKIRALFGSQYGI
tara:strand:+ start:505 stop:711 length:207 start_codon:yes stop_codon:yes gene_type:complete